MVVIFLPLITLVDVDVDLKLPPVDPTVKPKFVFNYQGKGKGEWKEEARTTEEDMEITSGERE